MDCTDDSLSSPLQPTNSHRNAVTGAHYHFVSRLSSWTSYLAAALVMMVFVSTLTCCILAYGAPLKDVRIVGMVIEQIEDAVRAGGCVKYVLEIGP